MKPATVFLLRHGHTINASPGRYIGQTDVALSPKGVRQAEGWAEWFSGVPLKQIACSNLKRSADTANIIGRRCRIQPTVFPELKEINLGDWDGLEFQEIQNQYPESFKLRGKRIADFRPPGGESFIDLQERVISQFQKIMSTSEENALMVGHAGSNRVLLSYILGMPLKNLFRINQDFGALNIIEIHPSGWRVQALNMTLQFGKPDP
jgi:probable phosphoglycerate mutase